jgi:hypothetical protein
MPIIIKPFITKLPYDSMPDRIYCAEDPEYAIEILSDELSELLYSPINLDGCYKCGFEIQQRNKNELTYKIKAGLRKHFHDTCLQCLNFEF